MGAKCGSNQHGGKTRCVGSCCCNRSRRQRGSARADPKTKRSAPMIPTALAPSVFVTRAWKAARLSCLHHVMPMCILKLQPWQLEHANECAVESDGKFNGERCFVCS